MAHEDSLDPAVLNPPAPTPGQGAKSRYSALCEFRLPFLNRARAVSSLTIPTEIARQGHTAWQTFPTPYQSAGARGVNSMASKLSMTLFPPSTPFFMLDVDPFVLQKAIGEVDDGNDGQTIQAEIEETMGLIERSIAAEIDRQEMRPALNRANRHIVIGGNALIHIDDDLRTRMFPLERYCVVRDSFGDVAEIVVFESVDPTTLDAEEKLLAAAASSDVAEKIRQGKPVGVYTWVKRLTRLDDGTDMMEQVRWIEDVPMVDSRFEFRWDETPWIPLVVNRADEESYGRGVAEEAMGDLKTLEGLTRSVVEAAVAAARIIWLVKPGSTIRLRSLATAPNGAFREGDPEDVGALRLEKSADLAFAVNVMTEVERRLDEHFLRGRSVQRQGERVTAHEISFMIRDLEETQAGVYSNLAGDFQRRLVRRIMAIKRDDNSIPPLKQLPRRLLDVRVVAGLEGLGRGADFQRLRLLFQVLHETIGPEATAGAIEQSEAISRLAVAAGVSAKGLVKSAEKLEQERARAQAAEIVNRATPNVAKVGAEAVAASQQE